MRRPHLTLVPPAPEPVTRTPLISSRARKLEAEGKRFYERAHLKPEQIPGAFRAMTAYPTRVRRSWRTPAAVAFGAFVGLAALGLHAGLVTACAIGSAAALSVRLMDGWAR